MAHVDVFELLPKIYQPSRRSWLDNTISVEIEKGTEERTSPDALRVVWPIAIAGDVVGYSYTAMDLFGQYIAFI